MAVTDQATFVLAAAVLRVHDLDAALAWYRDTFGLEPTAIDARERRADYELGGATLTLWQLRGVDRELALGYAGTFPRLRTSDLEQAWHRLRDRGVLVEPITSLGGVRQFELRDLDGNRLDVVASDGGGEDVPSGA